MIRLIQPLSEHFLYCSPETMDRELYRLYPVPRTGFSQQQKKPNGDGHAKAKTA